MTNLMLEEIIKSQCDRYAWLNLPEVTAWCEERRREREEEDDTGN